MELTNRIEIVASQLKVEFTELDILNIVEGLEIYYKNVNKDNYSNEEIESTIKDYCFQWNIEIKEA